MMKKNLKKAVIALSLSYFFVIALLFIFQKKLEYHPRGKIGEPSAYSLVGFSEVYLVTRDNLKILSWYKAPNGFKDGLPRRFTPRNDVGTTNSQLTASLRAQRGNPSSSSKKIILYFHGNSGNLAERSDKFKTFSDAGFGVMAISYQGFAGSEGDLSESGIINDARAAIEFLLANNYQKQDIILFGESLGTGVAVQMAALFDVYAVVLESPFSSIASVAQKKYWFAPISLILKDGFDSAKYADKISSPVLIFHGTDDRVVPYAEAENLYEKIKSPKKFITIKGAGHLKFGNEFLLKEMMQFFSSQNKNYLADKKY